MQARLPALLTVHVLVCVLATIARGQTAEALDRYRDLLYRKPHHEFALERIFQAHVADNTLRELIESYETAATRNPDEVAFKVILARLFQRSDEPGRALELLHELGSPDFETLRLLGELELARGDGEAAVAALERAAEGAPRRLRRELLADLGAALLAVGRREEGVAAFRGILELASDKESAHSQLAGVFARHGLFEEAHAEYRELLAAAGEDPEVRARVLRDVGALLEREGKDTEAVDLYQDAMTLVLRGHWLRDEFAARMISAAQRCGRLQSLALSTGERLEESGASPEDHEFLATIQLSSGDLPGAEETLERAIALHPADLALSEALRGVYQAGGKVEEQAAELERILGSHPDTVDLYLELARFLASTSRVDDAFGLWRRAIERNLVSPDVALSVAQLFSAFGEHSRAVEVLEHALSLAPGRRDLSLRMAEHLLASGASERAEQTLTEMVDITARDAPAQERGAAISAARALRDGGRIAAAIALARRAVALERQGDDLLLLAELHREAGEHQPALDCLTDLVSFDQDVARRARGIRIFIAIHEELGDLDQLVAEDTAETLGSAASPAELLIAAEAYRRLHRPLAAAEVYERIVELDPVAHASRRALADVLAELGELGRAAAELEHLVLADHALKIEHLTALARVHVARGDVRSAEETYERIAREASGSAKVHADLAEELIRLERYPAALESLRQAVRLDARDAQLRGKLARLLVDRGRDQEAIDEYEAALVLEVDALRRETLRQSLYEAITGSGALEDSKRRYAERMEQNPYDALAPAILAYIHARELEFDQAREMVDRALLYSSDDLRLKRMRAGILREIAEYDTAIADLEALRRAGDTDPEIQRELGVCHFLAGNLELARELWQRLPDPVRAAETFAEHDLLEEAERLYRDAIRRRPGELDSYEALGKLLARRGDIDGEAEVYARALDETDVTHEFLEPLVSHALERGDEARALELAHMMFEVASRSVLKGVSGARADSYEPVVRTLSRLGMRKQLGDILLARAGGSPPDYRLAVHAAQFLTDELDRLEEGVLLCRRLLEQPPSARRLADLGFDGLDDYRARWLSSMAAFYKKDYDLRRRRYEQLEALATSGAVAPIDHLEAALIANSSGETEPQVRVLLRATQALAGDPAAIPFLGQLAAVYAGLGLYVEAESTLAELEALIPHEATGDDLVERRVQRYLRNSFGSYGALTAEEIGPYFDVISLIDGGQASNSGASYPTQPRPMQVRLSRGRMLLEAGQRDEGRTLLLEAVQSEDAPLVELSAVAQALDSVGLREDAFDVGRRALERLARLEALPLGKLLIQARRNPLTAIQQLGVEMEKGGGDPVRAYDLLRDMGDEASCRTFLRESVDPEAVQAHYQELMDAQQEPVRAAIRRAEVDYLLGRHAAAAAGLAQVLQLEPDSVALLDVTAHCEDLAELYETAITRQHRILELLATAPRAESQLARAQRELLISPLPPGLASQSRYGGRSSRRMRYFSFGWRSGSTTSAHVLAIARLMVKQGDPQGAVAWLRDLVEEGTRVTADEEVLSSFAPDVEPGDLLPLYRTVVAKHPTDFERHMEFAEVLVRAGQKDEAIEVYERMRKRLTGTLYDPTTYRRVEDALIRLRGEDRREEIATERADLASKLERNPRDVAARVKAIHLAAADLDLESAYAMAREGNDLMPFRPEMLSPLRTLARHFGDRDLEIQVARTRFDQASGVERANRCLELARTLLSGVGVTERDREEARHRLVEVAAGADETRKIQLAGLLSWGGWAVEAASILRELAADPSLSSWRRNEVLPRCISAIREADGEAAATDVMLELLIDPELLESWSIGELLRQLYPDEVSRDRLIARVGELREVAVAAAERVQVGRWLRVELQLLDQLGRERAAAVVHEKILELEPGNMEVLEELVSRYVSSGLLDRARELALQLIELQRLEPGVDGERRGRPLSGGERRLLGVLALKGDREAMLEILACTYDPGVPRTAQQYSFELAQLAFVEEGVTARQVFIDWLGEAVKASELLDFAQLLARAERHEQALEVLLEAEKRAGQERTLTQVRSRIDQILGELDRMDERIARQRARVADNPGNLAALKDLARVLAASGDRDGAVAAHQAVLAIDATDDESRSVLVQLATIERDLDSAKLHLAERAKRESRDAADIVRLQGTVAFLEGRTEEAYSLWERSIAGEDRWRYTHLEHAGRALALGNLDHARAIIEREASRPRESGWWWWNDRRSLLAMSRMQLLFGEPMKARQLLDQRLAEESLAEIDTLNLLERGAIARAMQAEESPGAAATAEELVGHGLARLFARDHEPARQSLERALDLDPRERRARDGLLVLARREGDVELERRMLDESATVLGKMLVAEDLLSGGQASWRFPRRVERTGESDWELNPVPGLPQSVRGYEIGALRAALKSHDVERADGILATLRSEAELETLDDGEGLFAYARLLAAVGRPDEARMLRQRLADMVTAASWWRRYHLGAQLIRLDSILGESDSLVDHALVGLHESFGNADALISMVGVFDSWARMSGSAVGGDIVGSIEAAADDDRAPQHLRVSAAILAWLRGDEARATAIFDEMQAVSPLSEPIYSARRQLIALSGNRERLLEVDLAFRRNQRSDSSATRELIFRLLDAGREEDATPLIDFAYPEGQREARLLTFARYHLVRGDAETAVQLARRARGTSRVDEAILLEIHALVRAGRSADAMAAILAVLADPAAVVSLAYLVPVLERIAADTAYSAGLEASRPRALLALAGRRSQEALELASALPEGDLVGDLVGFEAALRLQRHELAAELARRLAVEFTRREFLAEQGGRRTGISGGYDLDWVSPLVRAEDIATSGDFSSAVPVLRLLAGAEPGKVIGDLQSEAFWNELSSGSYPGYFGGETNRGVSALAEASRRGRNLVEEERSLERVFDPGFTSDRTAEARRLLREQRFAEAAALLMERMRVSVDRGRGVLSLQNEPLYVLALLRAGQLQEMPAAGRDLLPTVIEWRFAVAAGDLVAAAEALELLRRDFPEHEGVETAWRDNVMARLIAMRDPESGTLPGDAPPVQELCDELMELEQRDLGARLDRQRFHIRAFLAWLHGEERLTSVLASQLDGGVLADMGALGPLLIQIEHAERDGDVWPLARELQVHLQNGYGVPAERRAAQVCLERLSRTWLQREPHSRRLAAWSLELQPDAERVAAALAVAGDEPAVLLYLGRAQLELGDSRRALATLKRARAIAPAWRDRVGRLEIEDALARAYLALEEWELAREHLFELLASNPGWPLSAAEREVMFDPR